MSGFGSTVSASQDDPCTPDWANDKEPEDFVEQDIIDSYTTDDSLDYNDLTTGLFLRNAVDLGDVYSYRIATAGIAVTTPDYKGSCYGLGKHGVQLKAKEGSLWSPDDKDEIMVVPGTDDGNSHDVASDVGFTILMGLLGSANIYASAGAVAADIFYSSVYDNNTTSTDENNTRAYWWETEYKGNNAKAMAHYLDFYVEADYSAEVEIVDTKTKDGNSSCDEPETDNSDCRWFCSAGCRDEYTLQNKFSKKIYPSFLLSDNNGKENELTEEEYKQLPDEILEKHDPPFYHVDANMS